MAAVLMEDDVGRLHAAVGAMRSELSNLIDRFEESRQETLTEHRKVHEIVLAQSEALRNVDRDVREIRPLFEDYRLRQSSFNEAVDLARDYRDRRAEWRGAWKLVIALSASVGAIVMLLLGKLLDKWK